MAEARGKEDRHETGTVDQQLYEGGGTVPDAGAVPHIFGGTEGPPSGAEGGGAGPDQGGAAVMTAELSRRRRSWPRRAGGPALLPARGDGPGGSGGGGSPLLGSGIPGGAEGLSGVGLHTGVTFGYTQAGEQRGLCRAERLIYITTAGGPAGGSEFRI